MEIFDPIILLHSFETKTPRMGVDYGKKLFFFHLEKQKRVGIEIQEEGLLDFGFYGYFLS